MVKNLPVMQEIRVQFLDQEDPLEEGMVIHSPEVLPGESHGQRSLAGHKQPINQTMVSWTISDIGFINYGVDLVCRKEVSLPKERSDLCSCLLGGNL